MNLIITLLMIITLCPGVIEAQSDSRSPEISQHWLKDMWEKNRKENPIENEGDAFQTNILNGESTNNFFGKSAASAGDVNNDGFEDVIVGAYGNSSFKGKAYIFLGGVTMDNSADIILIGENDSDRFGYCVSTAGDVDGDGFADVVVGAIGHNSMTGKVYIFLGGSSMNNVADIIITGEASGNLFGVSVSTAGDMNNDGFSDVIIGAEGYNSNTGKSYVYFGSAVMDNVADLTLNGIATDNFFGTSVSSAGDVNNDNYDDILVGAKGFNSNSGQAYIFLGGSSPNNVYGVVMTGDVTSNFGNSVSFAGDVNADGYDDVVIGAYTNSSIEYNGGEVCVYYGGASMDSTADVTFNTPGYYWQFGTTVASAKDMNGDGFSDILIGAYNGNNTLVFFGGDSMNTVYDVVLQNGYLVSPAGDINGDGYTEALVGSPSASSSTGKVYVYNYAFENQISNDLVLTGTPMANFTSGLHIGGDYNNDGIMWDPLESTCRHASLSIL